MTARVTNGVYVRLNPSRAANASFTRCRVRTTCSMLTSTMFHARAVVCSDPTMCDAIALRMCDIGTISSPPRPRRRRRHGTQRRRRAGGRCGRAAAGAGASCRDRVHHVLLRDPPPGAAPETARDRAGALRPASARVAKGSATAGPRSGKAEAAGAGDRRSPEGWRQGRPWSRGPDSVSSHGLCAAAEGSAARPRPGGVPSAAAAPSPESTSASAVPTATVVAFRHEDLGHRARDGRRHLGVDLVRRQLEERLVDLDLLALLLQPFQDRALDDRLAELRHLDRRHLIASRLTTRRAGRRPPRSRSPVG